MTRHNIFSPLRNPAIALGATALFAMSGCIEDDTPYPFIHANILEMAVEGQIRSAAIDSVSRTVSFVLNDSVNPASLKVTRFIITPGAHIADTAMIVNGLNLTDTLSLTLSIYQDYVWKISAKRQLNLSFKARGQIGNTVIDPELHSVTLTFPTGFNLAQVEVEQARLGGAYSVITPSLTGSPINLTAPLTVNVTEFGKTESWTISALTTDLSVELTSVDAWTNVAWLYASAESGRKVSFYYRVAGEEGWSQISDDNLTDNNGSWTCRLSALSPSTTYEARAVAGEDESPAVTFTTGENIQPANRLLQNWWLDGKVWCPWAQDATPFWGTGNKGATTLGDSNTTPITDPDSPTGYAGARLETRFVGIAMLGKLAAGNLFAGDYVRTDGTNGVLSFGRPFTQRPTAVRVTFNYTSTPISHSNNEYTHLKGQPDTCTVWSALIDSPEPFEIRTKPSDRQLFSPDLPQVVAYAHTQRGSSTDGYVTAVIPFNYVATNRVPTYILMVASASKYGDFFTGGNGSVLLVKEWELLYDYPLPE